MPAGNKVKAFSGTSARVEQDIADFQRYFKGNIVSVSTTSAAKAPGGSSYASSYDPEFLVVITYNEDVQD